MQLTSSPRRALGLLAACTIGLSTALLGVTGTASAAVGPNVPTIADIAAADSSLVVFIDANQPADDDVVTPWSESFEYSLDGGTTPLPGVPAGYTNGFDAAIKIDGLDNGDEVSVVVRGVDEDGNESGWSAPKTATPHVGAGAPGDPVVTVGPASITVTWTAATQGTFPITGYQVDGYVTFGEGGGNDRICETTATTLTCTVTKMPGWKYRAYVRAVDSKGNLGAQTAVSAEVTIPAAGAPAAVPAKNGDLTLAPTSAGPIPPGKKITVTGTGYAPGSTVTVVAYSTPQVLTTVVADVNGNFSVEVTVPATLAVGNHTLVASGVDANGVLRYVTLPITVTAAGTAQLAATGADVALPVIGGIAALGLGAGLVVVARRRAAA